MQSCHLGECLPDAIIRQANNERRDFSGMSTETFDSVPRTLHSSAPTQHQTSERGRGSVATDPLLGNANVIPSLPQPVISGRVGRPIRPEIIQARRRHTPVRTERRRPGKSRRKGTSCTCTMRRLIQPRVLKNYLNTHTNRRSTTIP